MCLTDVKWLIGENERKLEQNRGQETSKIKYLTFTFIPTTEIHLSDAFFSGTLLSSILTKIFSISALLVPRSTQTLRITPKCVALFLRAINFPSVLFI